MLLPFTSLGKWDRGRPWWALLALWLWLPLAGHAQTAPAWNLAITGSNNQLAGTSSIQSVATDASGNVFVTGFFSGQVAFGSTVLTSQGGNDLFVAKYLPASGTWAWAQSGGGTSSDQGNGIAVSGNSVYVTGHIFNNAANANAVLFGGVSNTAGTMPVNGASTSAGQDIVVARYTDNGTSAALDWLQVSGGTGGDVGNDIAVSGNSVYITGYITNNTANTNAVLFGGTGSMAGTVQQNGASTVSSIDLVVAKYTDNGTSAALAWTQVGGGTSTDTGAGIAISGTSVYVTGSIVNNTANAAAVLFGGTGTTAGTAPQNGASSVFSSSNGDLLVVKYTDNGTSAALAWTQVGGGIYDDRGNGVAVSGNSLYVTGYIQNNTSNATGVLFGGTGTTAGTVQQNGANAAVSTDLVVAKYIDNGTAAAVAWTQVGGGTGSDIGNGIAASGNSVYVTGYIANNAANTNAVLFGGAGTTAGTVRQNGASTRVSNDLVVAKYTDNGTAAALAWTQVGGGTDDETSLGIAVNGSSVYAAGYVNSSVTHSFGAISTSVFAGTYGTRAAVGQLSTDLGNWQSCGLSSNGGQSSTQAMAMDASGNVFVTGSFSGQVFFGSTVLSSRGFNDIFVAKYLPASGTWAWAQSGGGTNNDQGMGIAVSGNNVYVTGSIINNMANDNAVLFGGTVQQNGASTTTGSDLVVAKYTDNGTSAALVWTQVGGGKGSDGGSAIAVNGNGVYVTGSITNNKANAAAVLFGGTGTTAGTVQLNGITTSIYESSDDLVVVKYTDNGPSATLVWAQVGGGTSSDAGSDIAVSGSSVYVTGFIVNNTANANAVLFGGTGTTAGTARQNGASATNSQDLLVAKYTDNGTSAALAWTQVGGGTGSDTGRGIAVSGNSVYVTGFISNNTANANAVLFGGTGTTAGTMGQNGASTTAAGDLVVAKYTDNGTSAALAWTQVGGGTYYDSGYDIAVSGNSVYVTGFITNNAANANAVLFGGTGTTAGTVQQSGASATIGSDLLVAKYTDNGTSAAVAWTQVGGGTRDDQGKSIAVSGRNVYAAGSAAPVAIFGNYAISRPAGNSNITNVLVGSLDVPIPTLTSLSPASGPVGTSITLTGTNFSSSSAVSFNGTIATVVTYVSTTSLTAVVPAGTTTGNVIVITSDGTSNGLPFTVTLPVATWTGSLSSDWFTAGNWSPAQVPDATLDATIPGAPSGGRFPAISAGTAQARNLILDSNATLMMSDGTLALAGSLTNNGTFQPTGGTVSLGGSTLGSVLGSGNTSFWNLTVGANGAQQSTSATTSVQRLLTLNGSFATNGNPFTLLSDATGTAMVVNTGSNTVNGNVTVQRYLDPSLNPNLGYRHVAAPISNATVGSLTTGSFAPVVNSAYNSSATPTAVTPFPTVYGYDQSRLATTTNHLTAFSKGWFSPGALTDALTVGQGYTVLIGAGQAWNFTGPLNNGNVSLNLARNTGATASDAGLSLVGNPYPSPLDWSAVQDADRPGLDAAIYVFRSTDPANPYSGDYGFYQNGIGTISPILAQGQAFFVRVTPGQTSGTLNLTNAHRPTTYAAPTYRRTATETRPLVHLSLRAVGSAVSDDAFVYFQAGATSGYDAQYDAEKLSNPSGLNISTILSAALRLSIDGRAPLGTAQLVIPLAVGVPAVGTYTLRATELLNLAGTPTALRDLQTGTVVDLAQQPSYSFTVSNASALITNRFELVFSPQQALAAAPAALAQQVALYPNPATSTAFVTLPASLGRQPVPATLLDALGRPVRSLTLPAQGATAHALDLRALPSGVYLLRLDTPAGTLVKKLTVE